MLAFAPEKIRAFVFFPLIIFSVVSLQLAFSLRNGRNGIFGCFIASQSQKLWSKSKTKQNKFLA